MAAWYIVAAAWAAGTALQSLMRGHRKPPKPDRKFQQPTTREGERPVLGFGTFRVNEPTVLWFGDVRSQVVERKNIPIGVKYWAGVHFGVCFGPADIFGVYIDDKELRPEAVQFFGDFYRLKFNNDRFFGGEEQQGGITGDMDFYFGSMTQGSSDYLETQKGHALSAHRGLCHAVARGIYWGMSGRLPAISFVCQAFPNELGLPDGHHKIGADPVPQGNVYYSEFPRDANPACVIYHLLTAPKDMGGAAIPGSKIDVASLRSMGETLYTEELGISGVLDGTATVRERIDEILRHVDGERIVDPSTGLLSFRLIRPDYDPDTIPVFDVSQIEDFQFTRVGWQGTKNMVQVRFTDRQANYVTGSALEIDRAGLDIRGGQGAAVVIDLPLLSTRHNAQKASARVRAAVSAPFGVATFKVNRMAHALRRTDPIKIVWDPLGIESLICRVTAIGYGTLEDPRISIDAVEDVFGLPVASFTSPPGGAWTDPSTSPVSPVSAWQVVEAPYELVKSLPMTDTQPVGLAVATPGPGLTQGWDLWVNRRDGTWVIAARGTVAAPRGRLAVAVEKGDITIRVTGDVDLDSLRSVGDAEFAGGANLLWLADEFIAFRDVLDNGDGTWTLSTIARGCLDTTPQSHSIDKQVWFLTRGWSWVDLINPVSPEAAFNTHVIFQAFNAAGAQDRSQAPERVVSVPRPIRATRPICPGRVRLNGADYPDTIVGELAVSWSHRNRLAAWSYADSGLTAQSETGTTYTVEVYGELGTLVHRQSGIGSLGWTYPSAVEIAESGLGRLNVSLRVVVFATRGGSESHERFDHTVTRP